MKIKKIKKRFAVIAIAVICLGGVHLYLAGAKPAVLPDDVSIIERDGSETDIVAANQSDGEETDESAGDIAPMIYVDDTLYMQPGSPQGDKERKEEFVFLGTIESMATSGNVPQQNFQANTPIVGSEVYQYGENLAVKIEDTYWLYEVCDL